MKKEFILPPSVCDYSGKLGAYGCLSLFCDAASEHGHILGVGNREMREQGLFWLAVQSRVRFHSLPSMNDTLTLSTWPGIPARAYTNRYYSLEKDGVLLVEGKTKWAVFDFNKNRLAPLNSEFFMRLTPEEKTLCDGDYARVSEDFSNSPKFAEYRVRSSDIDVSGHFNNVAYVRAIEGLFSTAQLAENEIYELDIAFRNQCFEGEVLSAHLRKSDDGAEIGLLREDGKPAALVKVTFK